MIETLVGNKQEWNGWSKSMELYIQNNRNSLNFYQKINYNWKTSAVDTNFVPSFYHFQDKYGFIFSVNQLPADESHE